MTLTIHINLFLILIVGFVTGVILAKVWSSRFMLSRRQVALVNAILEDFIDAREESYGQWQLCNVRGKSHLYLSWRKETCVLWVTAEPYDELLEPIGYDLAVLGRYEPIWIALPRFKGVIHRWTRSSEEQMNAMWRELQLHR